MKRLAVFAITFLLVCLCGLFVAAAGGVVWGTEEAGKHSFITFVFAFIVAGTAATVP